MSAALVMPPPAWLRGPLLPWEHSARCAFSHKDMLFSSGFQDDSLGGNL